MRLLLAVFLIGAMASWSSAAGPPRVVDESQARAAGIRKLAGKHLTLWTDVAPDDEVKRLPAVFDQAVPQWAAYCGVDAATTADWHMQGYLIEDRQRFDALGLMPAGHDGFRHGLALDGELWLYEQPTAYYRRHLLLHEGTHAFMANFLGGCGPGWFMEGTAELLATHTIEPASRRVKLRYMPRSRQEVPMLGRIKLVQTAYAENRALALENVLALDNRRQLENEAYAWCWALARLLDDHPRYRERFRGMLAEVRDPEFNQRLRELLADDWSDLSIEWQNFVATLDHGHDVAQTAIDFRRGQPLAGEANVEIAARRGWQSSGARLEAGQAYRVVARGRYQIAEDDEIWWCEPGGVTIEYHAGRPLGMLLGAIDSHDGTDRGNGFLRPLAFGLEATITPEATGTLYLRVNDSPGRLDDNRGKLSVTITQE